MTVKEMIALFGTYPQDDRVVILVDNKLVDITMISLESPEMVKLLHQQNLEQGAVVLCPAPNGFLDSNNTPHNEYLLAKCKDYLAKKAIHEKS